MITRRHFEGNKMHLFPCNCFNEFEVLHAGFTPQASYTSGSCRGILGAKNEPSPYSVAVEKQTVTTVP